MGRRVVVGPVVSALLAAAATGCTETELVSHVVLLDLADGSELERRSRPAYSAGWVRVAARPGEGDVLAWGGAGKMDFRAGQWEQVDLDMDDFDVAAVDGAALPEVFAFAQNRAFLWSPASGQFVANLRSQGSAHDVVAADWDGDGDIDVVAVAADAGAWFHPREPDGLGEAVVLADAWGTGQYLAIGDLDADGRLDLVRTDEDNVHVGYAGDAGAIDEEVATPHPATELRSVEVGDIDGDGDLDVVLAGVDGIHVLDNGGDRMLSAGASVFDAVTEVELVDIDQDGDVDILGQPPREDDLDEPFGRELLLLESRDGELGSPQPFTELAEYIVDLATGTDANGTRWLAVSAYSHERVRASPVRR